jgi:predicted ATPase/DNA-binding winged helix-turn-helix (wHTH) protein
MTPDRCLLFGPFRLDPEGRVLYLDGRRVALTPKAVDVLVVLVEGAGQPVSREDLLSRVWAGSVVEEGSLTSHVSLLRKALAEGGGDGYIETLSKRGYRFAGPLAKGSEPAPPAPLRTLTFLFAAIAGGTASPDAATVRLRDTLRRIGVDHHGGIALRVVEDAFCVAFPEPIDAVRAALDVQRALRTPDAGDSAVDARMGLHSGATEATDSQEFSGPTLARAAQVMAAAHGGQILLTAATVALLDRSAPQDGELRDLGDHTLRGFARPERLYQLDAPGMQSGFAPIRTRETMRTNLPPSLTPLIGRREALAEVGSQVLQSRMVTLVGAGGTGKTRLALEAARQLAGAFTDGVWLVELAPLTGATLVAQAIAHTLGARAEGDTPSITLIESTLRDQRALLLIDNCEHVIDEAAAVAQALLRGLPRLHLMTTSREALGIEGEVLYRVPSLTMPGPHDSPAPPDLIASEAGQLFVERAKAVQSAFDLTEGNAAAVARICRRLDGIPLAIELAAARLTALSVEEVAQRIDDRFRLLTGGLRTALPRQRTLRGLVDWSYDLLDADEQRVLSMLSVFAGSFTLAAAEQVCADDASGQASVLDAIEHLVSKSLLLAESHGASGTRYRLLETIRQYASEKLLEKGLHDTARRRHFECFLELARTGVAALTGPLVLEWLDRLEAEHDNLRAALDGTAEAHPRDYARLAGTLRTFWEARCHYSEAWTRLERAIRVHAASDEVRLDALIGAGLVAFRLAFAERSDEILGEARALARELGDLKGEAEAALWLGHARRQQGPDAAQPVLLEALALANRVGDRRCRTIAAVELARVAMMRNEFAEARDRFLELAKACAESGYLIEAPSCLLYAGQCAFSLLDFTTARRLLEDALVQLRRLGQVHEAADALLQLGQLAFNENRLGEALTMTAESLRTFRALHDPKCAARTSVIHATVLRSSGDGAGALTLAESAAATYSEMGFPLQAARALCAVGCIHDALGRGEEARHALFSGLVEQQRADRDTALPELLEAIAGLCPGAPGAAQLLGSAAAMRERLNVPLLPSERRERERRHADVRARRPGAEFACAFETGRALARDDAIRNALALLRDG